jgi:hypothetical protein
MATTFGVPPSSVIAATVTYMYGAAECEHKLHFMTKAAFADMFAVCAFVQENVVKPYFLTRMVGAVEYRSTLCTLVGGTVFDSAVLFPEQETFGTMQELGAMPIVANVMQLRTGTAGRHGRGRIFWFGFPQAYIENYNRLTPFAFIQYRNTANAFESQFTPEGSDPFAMLGVFSYWRFRHGASPEAAFSPLKYINVQSRLSSMSKRRS